MTKENKTQWHPAFCSAMKLELREDSEYLDYESEHNLNSSPLEIDLLIVKKIKEIELKNEIGKIFRKHNIVEYKSPKDTMNVNTYLKVNAYACLYKTQERHVDDIKLEDITITMVREKAPRKLLHWFLANGYRVNEQYTGIYYIEKENSFPTQIIVSEKLSKENQKWLTLLSSNLSEADANRTLVQIKALTKAGDKLCGDSVLQVAASENKKLFFQIKEEGDSMCEVLKEIFAVELAEALRKNTTEVTEQVTERVTEQVTERVTEQVTERMTKANQQKFYNMITSILQKGYTAEMVSELVNLPLEEVQEIENKLLQAV